MSYFGVSNPELDAPLSGMRAARRGRARAQRKRQSHSQMAGRNGGFADPREIMAYHNKGELSDAATIQALSLFGIGGVRAKGMLGGSHRARQQSALMGARRQQASFRSMGSHDGRPDNISVYAYQDRNGGNWSIEINQVGAHIGVGSRCDWRIKSIDSDNPMYNVWVKSGTGSNLPPAKSAAQAAIEELVEDAPQDFVVDEFGENYQDSLASFPRWSLWYYTQYTGGQISWVNWEIRSVTLNLSYTGQAETKAAARVAALNAVDAWVATQQVNNDGDGDATGDGNGSNFSQTFTFNHPGFGSASGIGPSVWTIVATLTADNWTYTASSPNWDFPVNADRTYFSADAARMGAEDRINNSIMASIPDDDEGTGGSGGDTGGSGGDTGGSGVSTSDLTEYTSAQAVIDGRKLGVIGYMDALNTLVNQFGWSENNAAEALRTESSSNDYYISDTDGDTFRETGVDNTLPVQAQAQQVVPASTGFNMPSTPVLVGGAILVAGVTAVAYTSRRN